MSCWVDKYESPKGRGALRVNELESSLSGEVGVGWRQSVTHSLWPEILQASLALKGFLALKGGPNIWSPPLSSLASLAAIHLVMSSSDCLSLLFSTYPPSACPPLHTFPVSSPFPPPRCSSLSLSEPEEWGWQVHGWEERKGQRSRQQRMEAGTKWRGSDFRKRCLN